MPFKKAFVSQCSASLFFLILATLPHWSSSHNFQLLLFSCLTSFSVKQLVIGLGNTKPYVNMSRKWEGIYYIPDSTQESVMCDFVNACVFAQVEYRLGSLIIYRTLRVRC